MLEARCCLCQVFHSNRRTQYPGSAKRVGWGLSPACQAKTTFFTRTIMLYEKGVALGQVRPLNIDARPTAYPSISRAKLSLFWPNDGNAPAKHSLAISLDIIRRKDKIEVSLSLRQAIQHTLLGFTWRAHSDQLKVGITDHNNTISGAP